jgi:thioredoxin reductase
MTPSTNVAIIGAGPYGLSIAAHLRERGIDFRIFGSPLRAWRSQMPKDMFLKSEGFASNLYDPQGQFTLERFCADNNLPYAPHDSPVPLDTFTAYGVAFQKHLVAGLEEKLVTALKRVPEGFHLTLDNGETLTARRVVVAAGLSDFRQIPTELAALPPEVFSHSAEHHDLSGFKGRDVSVIGGGSSALDVVASLRACGAHARLVARRPALKWNMPVKEHSWRRWYPASGLGDGWRNAFFEHAPMVFRFLPQETRMGIVRRWLGPAGGWPARRAVEQGPVLLGQTLRGAEYRDGRVQLRLSGRDGMETIVATDHVIAATGYKVDLRRLGFLDKGMQTDLRTAEHTPILSPNFESSVPDLYFVGLAAANTFGPVMRFLLGARYTARRLTRQFSQPVVAQ